MRHHPNHDLSAELSEHEPYVRAWWFSVSQLDNQAAAEAAVTRAVRHGELWPLLLVAAHRRNVSEALLAYLRGAEHAVRAAEGVSV